MDITLGELNKLSIAKLKSILLKLKKEPKNSTNDASIDIIKNLIRDKKRHGFILHPNFIKTTDGMIPESKRKPVNFMI